MTSREQQAAEEELIRLQEDNPDYWGDQDENGVDLARLRENLRLSPEERLRRNDNALMLLRQMEKVRARERISS